MQAVKGMVQVAGNTYRIIRVARGLYEVVRILDDTHIGSFRSTPKLEITTNGDEALMRDIARAAIKWGKTSWVGRLNFA
jgi:hypothetical protein